MSYCQQHYPANLVIHVRRTGPCTVLVKRVSEVGEKQLQAEAGKSLTVNVDVSVACLWQ